jgi:hypothetical protein
VKLLTVYHISEEHNQRDAMEVKGIWESLSTLVFNDPCDESAVLDYGPEHFGNGFLLKDAFLLALDRQTDVDCAALRREYLHSETVLRQIDLTRVCGIELDCRDRAGDLDCERG